MLPHDPDLATTHHSHIEYDEDGLPVTNDRPRAWGVVLGVIAAAVAIGVLWWFLAA
jgi:hypothetical protein